MESDKSPEQWTRYDSLIRAALTANRDPSGAFGPDCLEPNELIALVEQGGEHPRADVLLRHVLDCGRCQNDYQEMRRTLALAAKATALQQARPQSAEPSGRHQEAGKPGFLVWLFGGRRMVPALGLAATALILAVVLFRPGGPGGAVRPITGVASSDGLPQHIREKVLIAMNTGRMTLPSLDFGPAASSGTRDEGGLTPVGPKRTNVLTPEPLLRWLAYPSAAEYVVVLTDETGRNAAEPATVQGTEWAVPAGNLQPGRGYRWKVTARRPGETDLTSQLIPFRVATREEAALVERAKRAHRGDRLFLGALLATSGFFDDAAEELSAIPSTDPQRQKGQQILGSIRAQREQR